jgi:hypothetical protein
MAYTEDSLMNGILEQNIQERLVAIPARSVQLEGHLVVPEGAQGIVLFAQIPSEKKARDRSWCNPFV